MSKIRFCEIRRISLNEGNLVHRLALILQRFSASAQMALPPVYRLHLLVYTHDKGKYDLSKLLDITSA
jgi:hypothetical protein